MTGKGAGGQSGGRLPVCCSRAEWSAIWRRGSGARNGLCESCNGVSVETAMLSEPARP